MSLKITCPFDDTKFDVEDHQIAGICPTCSRDWWQDDLWSDAQEDAASDKKKQKTKLDKLKGCHKKADKWISIEWEWDA